jgi:hypothetical protein
MEPPCNYSEKDLLYCQDEIGYYFMPVIFKLFVGHGSSHESFRTNLPTIVQPVLYEIYILYLNDILCTMLALLTLSNYLSSTPPGWQQVKVAK